MRQRPTSLRYMVRMTLWAVVIFLALWVIAFFLQRAIGLSGEEGRASVGGQEASRAGEKKIKVACWNHFFPFEYEEPEFLAAPGRCLWFKRKATTYFEDVVLGKKLEWEWGNRHATAEGRVKVEGVGDRFGEGRVRLFKPVESCGRTVFSKLRYKTRRPEGKREGEFPIYTCRSRPGQG